MSCRRRRRWSKFREWIKLRASARRAETQMIPMIKRILIAVLVSAAGILAAAAETYPSRVIRIIVPNIAGAPGDVVAPLVAQQLQMRIGQSVIVENRPGVGQTTGTK